MPPDKVVYDANLGKHRPSSNAFTDNLRDGTPMSVWEASVVIDPRKLLEGYPGWSVAAFKIADARNLGLHVIQTPQHGAGHCEVIGKKTKGIQSSLAKASTFVEIVAEDDPNRG